MSSTKIITNEFSRLNKRKKVDSYRFSFLLQRMNLSVSQLTPSFFLSAKAKAIGEDYWNELFIELENELDNKLLGYDLGSLIDLKEFGVLGKIVLNSDSFEEAILHIVKYVNMSNDVVVLKFLPTVGGGLLSIEHNNYSRKRYPVATKHFGLMLLGAIHGVYNLIAQQTLKPLQYQIPNSLQQIEGVFQIFENETICTEKKRISILLSNETLKAKSMRSNPALLENLLHQISESSKFMSTKWSNKVEQMLHHKYAIANVGLYTIATELGVGERALQRNLQEEKTSFKAIKEKVRLKLAKYTLVRTQNVDESAKFLGFSSSYSFNKFFRKWSGQSVWSFLECA